MHFVEDMLFILVIFVAFIIFDLIIAVNIYVKNKNSKVKHLYCRERLSKWFFWYIIITGFINIIWYIKANSYLIVREIIKKEVFINGIYETAILLIIALIVFIILQIINGSLVFVNDEFVTICSTKMKFSNINYVDISSKKGITGRRKVEISEDGKVKLRFSINDKRVEELVDIFDGKCRIIV